MTTQTTATRRPNGHDTRGSAAGDDEARCAYCGQSISGSSKADADEIRARIEKEERRQLGRLEVAIRQQFSREQQQAVTKAKKDAAAAAAEQVKALRSSQEEAITQRLAAQRETLGRQMDETLGAERARHFEERQRLESALADLQRKVQGRKHPVDVGEPLEVALHAALSSAFREDQCVISRVRRGRAGPDLVIEVIAGEPVGVIAVEAKAHARWSSAFVTKAKVDAHALSAAFIIIATKTMPKNTKGLTVIDGSVIVCEPDFLVPLVTLLREQMVALHRQRLSSESRAERSAVLLEFVASSRCATLIREFVQFGELLRALDEREAVAHRTVWSRRAELIKAFDEAQREFVSVVTAIMNGTTEPALDEEEVAE